MSEQTILQIESDNRAIVATVLCQDFDFQRTRQLKVELDGAKGSGTQLPLILDMTNVGFMPSLTIGALVELQGHFVRDKRQLTLVGIQPAIAKLLQTSGLLNLFNIRNNVGEAIN